MFLIERVSSKIGHNVATYLSMDKDHEEILTYGAIAILHTFFSVILVMIFGFLFHVFLEALIISFTASILRKYSGGVHSASPNRCAIIGTIISVGFGIAVVFISKSISLISMLILFTIGLIYSYYFINKYAPVDSPAKPINNILKRQRLKNCSIIIISIMYAITGLLLLLYIYSGNKTFFSYAGCITIGVVWQTFSLTHLGYKLLHKIDSAFIK